MSKIQGILTQHRPRHEGLCLEDGFARASLRKRAGEGFWWRGGGRAEVAIELGSRVGDPDGPSLSGLLLVDN